MSTLSHDALIADWKAKYKTLTDALAVSPDGEAAHRAQLAYRKAANRLHKAMDEARGRVLLDYLEADSKFEDAIVSGNKAETRLDDLLAKERIVKSLFAGMATAA